MRHTALMGLRTTKFGRALLLLAAACSAFAAHAGPPPDGATLADLAGTYDGGQMEIAAGLELRADGHFRYGLSYGAIDEQAEGSWTVERGQILLTAAPVVPPRFVLLSQEDAPAGLLAVTLDLPEGMSRQYFHVEWRAADGTATDRQLNEEQTPFDLEPAERPTAIRLTLPMFDVGSDTVQLSGREGHRVAFRFEPHDLGKPAFDRTPLVRDRDDLVLTRYDAMIRFRRVKP
jgi:hypothetical protein